MDPSRNVSGLKRCRLCKAEVALWRRWTNGQRVI